MTQEKDYEIEASLKGLGRFIDQVFMLKPNIGEPIDYGDGPVTLQIRGEVFLGANETDSMVPCNRVAPVIVNFKCSKMVASNISVTEIPTRANLIESKTAFGYCWQPLIKGEVYLQRITHSASHYGEAIVDW